MANSFTAARADRLGGPSGKTYRLVEGTLFIDTTALGGAVPGDFPASFFGLNKLISAHIVISDNSKNYIGTRDYLGTSLLVAGGAANVPMDLPNGTYFASVLGL